MHYHLFAVAAAFALSGCAYVGHGMHGGMHRAEGGPICGGHMMSTQERDEHHQRMHDASSDAERDRIRHEHHDRMAQRARERGLDWRDGPGCRGSRATN